MPEDKRVTTELILELAKEYIETIGEEPNAVLVNSNAYKELQEDMRKIVWEGDNPGEVNVETITLYVGELGHKIGVGSLIKLNIIEFTPLEEIFIDVKNTDKGRGRYVSVTRVGA